MASKTADIGGRAAKARAALLVVLALVLAASMAPAQAWAYFNRGSVSVALGATSLDVQAGSASSVTVSITPSSDNQTEGCGMPKCPQGCSETCTDENGQCRCAGADYRTYYPSATATSSNASVAVAVYSAGTLTVYGKQEGEAVITVRASLRQFTDAQATLSVKVSGTAEGVAASGANVEVPEAANVEQEDRAAVVEKTVMGRPVHMVRVSDSCDARAALASLAGVDGDVTFWQGDTYYHPAYSLTFAGSSYEADEVFGFSPELEVLTEASGSLNQPLSGLSEFVVVDFAHQGALPAPATVYVEADKVFAGEQDIALFSYDEAAKEFVREDAPARMSGGYATFSVQEGKTYVVSSRDLTTEANAVVTGGAGSMQGESCCSSDAGAVEGSGLPPFAYAVIGVICGAVLAAAGVTGALSRRKKQKKTGKEQEK